MQVGKLSVQNQLVQQQKRILVEHQLHRQAVHQTAIVHNLHIPHVAHIAIYQNQLVAVVPAGKLTHCVAPSVMGGSIVVMGIVVREKVIQIVLPTVQ